ncbi:MAG: DEAD/DEAH box helicase family protein [Planctomycetaceae bacterium]
MQLRPYQQAAVNAVYDHLRMRDDNPVCVIPTAGGKTPVIASICRDAVQLWNGRVLILAHVRELLDQAADKLRAVCPDLSVGVYSAGLGSRETTGDVIIAGIQSVHERAAELGRFDLVLIDECHAVPKDGSGTYRRFLAAAQAINPELRVIGFTATPYRLDSGPICSDDGPLHKIAYQVGVMELIRDGYLCRPFAKAGKQKADTSQLTIRGGEFIAHEAESLMNTDSLVASACDEIIAATHDRRSCIIFASGVAHATSISIAMATRGVRCEMVTGSTRSEERDRILSEFREGGLKYIVNVGVLTTGFDAPAIDCVVLLRPTMSPGLYYQMIGRGFRLHPDKHDCLILDFAGNVVRHGPVDCIAPPSPRRDDRPKAKECPKCQAAIGSRYQICPGCGYEFPVTHQYQGPQHSGTPTSAAVLSDDITDQTHEVLDVHYRVHEKRDADDDAPKSVCVEYQLGLNFSHREYVCVEHTGYARTKAIWWWRQRSNEPVPDTAEEAVNLAARGCLAFPEFITLRSIAGEKFDRIVDIQLGEKPAVCLANQYDDDEVPF